MTKKIEMIPTLKKVSFLAVFSAFTVAVAGACGGNTTLSSDASPDASPPSYNCSASEPCVCREGQVCDFACAPGGPPYCAAACVGAGTTCTANCAGGSCILDTDLHATAMYDCSGGNCVFDCDRGSSCEINCSGGGCRVGCDEGSTCKVACSAAGSPCIVKCAAEATATCSGNCLRAASCNACDPILDLAYKPFGDIHADAGADAATGPGGPDPTKFSNVVNHQFFPLKIGARWDYTRGNELIAVEVKTETYIAMGVTCVVVHDEVRKASVDGGVADLMEVTDNWYAQDTSGNVWHFGKATAEYKDGAIDSTAGSWEAGKDGALPGIVMKAEPKVGDRYRHGYWSCQTEDESQVKSLGDSVTVPAGSYTGCISIRDFTRLSPGASEIKTYCPGIGLVQVKDAVKNTITETLDSIRGI